MREIKFRAWEPTNKVMYPMAMVGEPANPSVWTSANWRECTEEVVIMQFTGLYDKNGKEIYEGDMFGKMGGDVERPGEYEIHAIVYFDEDLSAFCIDDNRGGWEYLFDYLNEQRNEREIIGNKWENPELLVQPTQPTK